MINVMENKENDDKKQNTAFFCPNCHKTVHTSRRYCNCHTDFTKAPVSIRISENAPDIGPCNVELDDFTCHDCPEDCAWCASFGRPQKNYRGFGGEDCSYRTESVRCYCCQNEVKLYQQIKIMEFDKLIKMENTLLMSKTAELIKNAIKNPILARIKQNMEKAYQL